MIDGKPVAVIPKNSREEIRVTLAVFERYRVVGTRVWVRKNDGGELPTKSGITVRVEKLDDLIAGLQAARVAAVREGWLAGGDPDA